jgi:hypothetical protein
MEFLLDKMRATRNNGEFFDPMWSGKSGSWQRPAPSYGCISISNSGIIPG